MLDTSTAGLFELAATGDLDLHAEAGTITVEPVRLAALIRTRTHDDLALRVELARQCRRALRDLLARTPATGRWETALVERRPLVCRRPGGPRFATYGIEYHAVVLSAGWVATHALGRVDEFPELGTLPIGPTLHDGLCGLDGVGAARHARALFGGGSHRLTRWVRVDPRVWPVTLPDDVARHVNGPVDDA